MKNQPQESMGPMPEASGSGVTDEDYTNFENKSGLAYDMKFLASMPELCDVTFLVGDTREPVCAVKAVLAARSRFVGKTRAKRRCQQHGVANLTVNLLISFRYLQSLPQDAVSSAEPATEERAAGAREQDPALSQTQL